MHYALAVCRIQGISDLDSQVQQAVNLDGTTANPVFQSHAIEVLHRNEVLSLVLADLVDRTNIGMV